MSKIIGIFGLQGTGKTMLLTVLGKQEQKKDRTVYSNYSLKNIPYKPISSFEDIEKIRSGVFLADELWLWIFARSSMSKINQELTKIVMLNRKRDLDIFYTAQLSREVDVLLRSVTNYWIYPSIKPFTVKGSNEKVFRLCYTVFDLLGNYSKETIVNNSLEYLGSFYNTHEEIGSLKNNEKKLSFGELGKPLEDNFKTSIKKLKNISIINIPNSGNKQDMPFDFIISDRNKRHYLVDVKSITTRNRVVNQDKDKKILRKIENATHLGYIPCWAFPKKQNISTKNPKNWFLCILNESKNKDYLKYKSHYSVVTKLNKNDLLSVFPY